MMTFNYDKNTINTQSVLQVSVSDLRDVIQAFGISDEGQRLKELQVVLESIVRKNRLKPGALGVK
jgi:hypothetical protein